MKNNIWKIFIVSIILCLTSCDKHKTNNKKNLLFPLALTGGNSQEDTSQGQGSSGTINELNTDPGSIYLSNIKAGIYQIKPRGEIISRVTSKIKSSEPSGTAKSNLEKNGNQNNGPQQDGDVDELWINIKEIQFVSDSGSKITIPSNVSSVDLLKLKNDATVLFSKAIVPEGKYNQIRLILNNPDGKVVKNGVEYSLKVPSGNQSGLKLNGEIDLVSGLLLEFTLDFDLHSLKYTPGQGYILRPTIPIGNIKTLLPFVHGMLLVKFKNQITPTVDTSGIPKTGVASIDDLIIKHNCIVIQKFIDNFSNMDMVVANEVGLDRVYLFYFKQSEDILLAMFDLAQDSNIQLVSPNHYMELAETIPNDPEANKNCPTCNRRQETYLTSINAYNGWDITKGKRNIRIAVIDTGVDDEHPDLVGKVTQNRSFFLGTCYHFGIWAYTCVMNGENSRPIITPSNEGFHGTHVAGIIGATANNNAGITGVNWESEILAINVFQRSEGTCINSSSQLCASELSVGSAIVEAVNANAKVINLSLGGSGYEYCQWCCLIRVFTHSNEFGSVQYADKKRVTVVASAGNGVPVRQPDGSLRNVGIKISPFAGSESFKGFYPASFNEVVSVAALNQSGTTRATFSNFGKIEISAPGEFIFSTVLNGKYSSENGTSMAAPMVSGFAGLILALDPNLHPKSVLEAMCANPTPVTVSTDPNTNKEYIGCGRINLGATLNTVSNSLPLPKITNNCGGEGETACYAGRWFEQFSFQFTKEGGVEPFKWSYSNGSLPHASSLNEDTGVLSGGPTYWFGPGWTFDVKVTDSRGKSDTKKVYFQSGL